MVTVPTDGPSGDFINTGPLRYEEYKLLEKRLKSPKVTPEIRDAILGMMQERKKLHKDAAALANRISTIEYALRDQLRTLNLNK